MNKIKLNPMKNILKISIILIHSILLAQEPPIKEYKIYSENIASQEHFVHLNNSNSKKTIKSTLFARTTTTNVNAIDYLTSDVTAGEVYGYLYNFSNVSDTDMFSDENVLSVVQYFKDTAIDLLDDTLSDETPFKCIMYFRAYEYHKYYQSSIDFADGYVDALFEALPILYNKSEYWSSDGMVGDFRWYAAMTMDIDGRRGEMYEYIKLHMNTNSVEFLSAGDNQTRGLSAVPSILWRGLVNEDVGLYAKMSDDTEFLNEYMGILNNTYLQTNHTNVVVDYISIINAILDANSRNLGFSLNINEFENMLLEYENSLTFATPMHMIFIYQMYMSNDYLSSDWSEWRQIYFDWEFPNVTEYNEEMVFYTSMPVEERDRLFLAIKEAKANFFKLTGETNPLPNDVNDTVNVYIFRTYDEYRYLSMLLSNAPAIGGGVYIEDQSAFFTFEREDNSNMPTEYIVKHEYVHYLDGRYNIHEGFGGSDFYDWSTGRWSFWSEGLADFIAATPRSANYSVTWPAAKVIRDDILNNSGIMDLYQSTHNPTYNGTRTYVYSNAAWSYLYEHKHDDLLKLMDAVRENRISDFQSNLDSITSVEADKVKYRTYLDSIKTRFDNTLDISGDETSNYHIFIPPLPTYEYSYDDTIEIDEIKATIDNANIISNSYEIFNAFNGPKFAQIEIDTTFNDMSKSAAMKLATSIINQKIDEFKTFKDLYSGFDFVTGWMHSIVESNNNITLKIVYELPQFGVFNKTLSNLDYVEDDLEVSAYPNPFMNTLNIKGNGAKGQIVLYDLNGRTIYKNYTDDNLSIDTGNIKSGMYILQIKNKNKTKSIKVIKR